MCSLAGRWGRGPSEPGSSVSPFCLHRGNQPPWGAKSTLGEGTNLGQRLRIGSRRLGATTYGHGMNAGHACTRITKVDLSASPPVRRCHGRLTDCCQPWAEEILTLLHASEPGSPFSEFSAQEPHPAQAGHHPNLAEPARQGSQAARCVGTKPICRFAGSGSDRKVAILDKNKELRARARCFGCVEFSAWKRARIQCAGCYWRCPDVDLA